MSGSFLGGRNELASGKSVATAAVTIINTVFNEGAVGANLTGTAPAVNTPGNLWVTWPTLATLTFASGGGVSASANFKANLINTGQTNYTVTFSGLINTLGGGFNLVVFSAANGASPNDRMQVMMNGAGGVNLQEVVGGTTTTVANAAVPNSAAGSVIVKVSGQSITVTAFGLPMSYTIPAGHADIGGTWIGLFAGDIGYKFGGVKITVP